ncbi:MAG: hypothetical protein K2G31_03320, partial [Clostridia bacterium]|nr:hypothetical protein [Clostridia bacterium]
AAEAGGAVYVYANSKKFTLNGGQIINNASTSVQSGNEKTSGMGGAIATTPTDGNTNAVINVTDGTIAYNSAVSGGAIYVQQATLNVENSVLANNSAKSHGGALCAVNDANVTIENTAVLENEAKNGGGISVSQEAYVTVKGGSLTENVAIAGGVNLANSLGGALYMNGGTANLIGVNVLSNASYGNGGAFVLEGQAPELNIEKCAITENNAIVNGGVMYISNGKANVKDVDTLKDNGNSGFNISYGRVTFENVKATNNGTDVILGSSSYSRLEVKGKVEIDHVSLAKNKSITVVGELLDGSNIHVDSSASDLVIATGYSNNNSKNGYAVNPSKFFTVNGDKAVMLLSDGTVKTCDEAVEWFVQYDGGEFTKVADYGVAFEYGEKTVTGVKFGDEVVSTDTFETVLRKDSNVLGDVVAHQVQKTLGTDKLAFQVYVAPVSLESDAFTIAVQAQSSVFTGSEIDNDVTITSSNASVSFTKDTDYVLSYKNNKNVGTAEVTVKGCGNYTGEVVRNFTITRNENFKYEIKWQHLVYNTDFNEYQWVDCASLNDVQFVYNGQNQSGDIRASLVLLNESGHDFANYKEYVYVEGFGEGFGEDDAFRSNGLKLVIKFKGTSNVTDFTNVNKEYGYSVTIEGESNAKFNDGVATTVDLEMHAAQLDITAEDFANGAANGLWQLVFGNNAVSLLNGADLNYFENGEIKKGNEELTDAYAYYRGANALKLELNGNFALTNKKLATLQSYLNGATVTYTPNEVTDVTYGGVKEVKTTATIAFGDNYTVAEGSGTIVLEKTWYVVTAVNAVLTTDNEEATTLAWTYGDKNFVTTKFAFRPQYGNDAIYTFVDGSGATVDRFAVVFDENEMTFYEVNVDGSIDKSSVCARVNNFYDNLYNLSADGYTLVVSVPTYASVDDFVVYSETTKSIVLNVAVASLTVESDESVSWNSGVKYAIPSRAVTYNGQQNNTPKISLVYNGITLVEGVDYLLKSENVDVTLEANLTVEGIGNFEGAITLEKEFEIMRANNYWVDSPSLPSW